MSGIQPSDWIAIFGIIISVITFIIGLFITIIIGLVGYTARAQIKSLEDRLAKHDEDIDKICDTLTELGKQMISCVEQIKTLFGAHSHKKD